MTKTPHSTQDHVSLDSVFPPPTRNQWAEMALAGLGPDNAGAQALQQLRRTTLEGIPLEVLYDSYDESLPSASTGSAKGIVDNRVKVALSNGGAAQTMVMNALKGGATSVELHVSKPAEVAASLDGVQLDLARISLRAGSRFESCAQALDILADAQGIDKNNLCSSLNADPIGTLLRSGGTDEPMAAQVERMAHFAQTTSNKLPRSSAVLVDVAIHHNAGASTVEELHAALATATLYLEALTGTGMSLKAACRQIVFQTAMDADLLLGVAKLRALRALWQQVITQFDDEGQDLGSAHIVAETSQRYLSKLEPWNNHLRNLAAGTAAILGGADALMVHPHDILQRSDTSHDNELGDRMARNIPIILERECGLCKVNDPMAGSYAIENLTHQLTQHTWQSLAATDTSEGWLDELHSGRWQTRLSHTHQQRLTLLEQEQRVVVGVNRFRQTDSDAQLHVNNSTRQPSPALLQVREAELFEQQAARGVAS